MSLLGSYPPYMGWLCLLLNFSFLYYNSSKNFKCFLIASFSFAVSCLTSSSGSLKKSLYYFVFFLIALPIFTKRESFFASSYWVSVVGNLIKAPPYPGVVVSLVRIELYLADGSSLPIDF